MKDFKMTIAALKSIASLARSDGLREQLGKANACDLITQILRMHKKGQHVLAEAFRAIIVLTISDTNRNIFGKHECCELLSGLLSDYYHDVSCLLHLFISILTFLPIIASFLFFFYFSFIYLFIYLFIFIIVIMIIIICYYDPSIGMFSFYTDTAIFAGYMCVCM